MIVSTQLIIGCVILVAVDFGPPIVPEFKLFPGFGWQVFLVDSVIAALA